MAILSTHFRNTVGQRALLVIGVLVWPNAAGAEPGITTGYSLRNQNPFLQIFGLPPFQSATLAAEGAVKVDVSLDIANHADAGDNALEDFVIDGESYFLTLSLRRRFTDRLEFGIDLPLVAHADGFLDNAIERWHDTFGMSNSKRRGPANQLCFRYSVAGNTLFELGSPTFGIGDMQLTAAMQLRVAGDDDSLVIAVRSSVKFPTGAEDELLGSGATDFSLGVYASNSHTFWKRDLDVSSFVGALLLGDGVVLSNIQRSTVPYGGIAATWWMTENFGITTQLYAQGAYFDSELEALGGNSMQLAVGGDLRLPRRGLSLLFAVVEDVSANATTDFALHFSVRGLGGR